MIIQKKEKGEIILTQSFSFLSIKNKNDKIPLINIIFSSICYFLYILIQVQMFFFFGFFKNWFNEISKFLQLVFTIILSYLILHIKVYRHNYLSIFFVAISSFIIAIFKYSSSDKNIYIVGFFLVFFFYSAYEISEKYILNKSYISPYLMLFVEGIFLFVYGIISLTILSYIKCNSDHLHCKENSYFFNFTQFISVINSLYFISQILLYIIVILI